ncbi:hypothetical protein [Polyangium sp. 15x6]|uniref:hypothetical protein n=1 Tax=Polyangium sp. 15x6 TaxID=3042687 RepID=UPI00249C9C62|nr:hypothetical protein [Polyangium sp. 15x6]MDI3289001.1 hypothetical protein [Polyangium sp. 15x6]
MRNHLSMALLAALALVYGFAPVDDALAGGGEESVESPSEEAADELQTREPVSYQCTVSGGLVSASMVAYPGPWGNSLCSIVTPALADSSKLYCTGTGVFTTCPDCQALRIDLSCPYGAQSR